MGYHFLSVYSAAFSPRLKLPLNALWISVFPLSTPASKVLLLLLAFANCFGGFGLYLSQLIKKIQLLRTMRYKDLSFTWLCLLSTLANAIPDNAGQAVELQPRLMVYESSAVRNTLQNNKRPMQDTQGTVFVSDVTR